MLLDFSDASYQPTNKLKTETVKQIATTVTRTGECHFTAYLTSLLFLRTAHDEDVRATSTLTYCFAFPLLIVGETKQSCCLTLETCKWRLPYSDILPSDTDEIHSPQGLVLCDMFRRCETRRLRPESRGR